MKRLDPHGPLPDMFPMPMQILRSIRCTFLGLAPLIGLIGCNATPPPAPASAPARRAAAPTPPTAPRTYFDPAHPVMLGIDVLQENGFAQLRGKSIGLLTHPSGVNMRGVSTIEVLRHAPDVHLVALFAAEHGVYGEYASGINFSDHLDPRTGLMVRSLYNGIEGRRGQPPHEDATEGHRCHRRRPAGHRFPKLHVHRRDEGVHGGLL